MGRKSIQICICLLYTNIFTSSAQFNKIVVENSSIPEIKVVQIDFRDLSTVVHFQFLNNSSVSFCTSENVYIQDNISNKKYYLLNSLNLPLCPNNHVFSEPYESLFFTLEFEKVPVNIGTFDIIEIKDQKEVGWSIKNCKIESDTQTAFMDVSSFIESTPVKEYGYYYNDGSKTSYYKFNGTVISSAVSIERKYGKYYQVSILIQNLSGRDRTFNPDLISVTFRKNSDVFSGTAIPYNEYAKKVINRQTWTAAAIALSEGLAAARAGYSETRSSGSSSGYSSTSGSANINYANNYGSIYGSSNTLSSTYGTTYSRSYNGAAAYAAQQNAIRNVQNYTNQLFHVNQQIKQGYAKIHTIKNGTEYLGYVNIKYVDADEMILNIPFSNSDYTFNYTFNFNSNYKFNSGLSQNQNPKTESSAPINTSGLTTENNVSGIYYKNHLCSIDKEISKTEVTVRCLNETGRAYDVYTIKKSELDFVGITYDWQVNTDQPVKKDKLTFEYIDPGIYFNGNNCEVDNEVSVNMVNIKCLNETGRAYYKYTVNKSELVFYKTTANWEITENLSVDNNSASVDNDSSGFVLPGYYFNDSYCKIIKDLPDGYVKIKILNETGRAYYRKIVLRSELVQVK